MPEQNELALLLQKVAAAGVKAAPHRLVILVVLEHTTKFEVGWNQANVTKKEIADFVLNIHGTFCDGTSCPIAKEGRCGLVALKEEKDAQAAREKGQVQ